MLENHHGCGGPWAEEAPEGRQGRGSPVIPERSRRLDEAAAVGTESWARAGMHPGGGVSKARCLMGDRGEGVGGSKGDTEARDLRGGAGGGLFRRGGETGMRGWPWVKTPVSGC